MTGKRKHRGRSTLSAKRLERVESSLKGMEELLLDTRKKIKRLNKTCNRSRTKPRTSAKKGTLYTHYQPAEPLQTQSLPRNNPWFPGQEDINELMKDSTISSLLNQAKKKNDTPAPTPTQPNLLGDLNQMLNLLQHPTIKSLFPRDQVAKPPPAANTASNQTPGPNFNQMLKLLENPAIQSLLKNVL
ncbi:hypothetical protein [Ammoniphilus sp. CFH 90114]|uniref:hypothetical protein n=1 Tax=Ammoniphilus sp. CFH 90114 TaxID=2493665 RepID=UPI00100F9A1F|nr:hypothetical protein [Ammoniphilus sp. CFH 90114]RXT06283.1 hypothetical protein EIZ39_14445 [Ammoniphilus sp. CFH 90114]